MLVDGAIDAAVRGTISARKDAAAPQTADWSPSLVSVGAALVRGRQAILFAPVGIDEGASTIARAHLVTETAHLLTALNVRPKVGVLSGGRSEDKGRTKAVIGHLQAQRR